MPLRIVVLLSLLLALPAWAEPELNLPASLEGERGQLTTTLVAAGERLQRFAQRHGWQSLTREPFYDRVEIYDQKSDYDRRLRELTGFEGEIPQSYVAALEERVLLAVSPDLYRRLIPENSEANAFEKLLCHEMAHRLHIRILEGNEERMGPIWFFEGFAVYASDQYTEASLSEEQVWDVLASSERGSYRKYRAVIEYLLDRAELAELVQRAGDADFLDSLKRLSIRASELRPKDRLETTLKELTVVSNTGIGRVRLEAPGGWPSKFKLRFTYANGRGMERLEGLQLNTTRGQWRGSYNSEFRPAPPADAQPLLQLENATEVLTVPGPFIPEGDTLELHWVDYYRQ